MSMPNKPPTPEGISLYGRSFNAARHGSPKQFAKKCADHGLKWFAIGGPWHEDVNGVNKDRWINKPNVVKGYADALADAGVTPHVWGYPWHDRVEKFIEWMEQCSSASVDGWLLDPELGLKTFPAEARLLVRLCRSSNPYRILGFSSFGLPKFHKTFPFDEFAEPGVFDPFVEVDYGSPQLYDTPQRSILEGMSDYAELGFDVIVPSYGLYKWVKKDASKPLKGKNRKAVSMTKAELDRHLLYFLDSEVPVTAMIGWAENFATPGLWDILSRWAARLERGACSLPT